MSEGAHEPEPERSPRYPFSPYPNGWFRALYSSELAPGAVRTLRRFGRDLVLFRSEAGQAHMLDPHCPHLGAHLGYGGSVVGERIRCPFHHWEFDGEGACRHVPYAKRIPARAKLRGWPVVEKHGIVFFHHDREGRAPGWQLPEVPELGDPAWLPLDVMHWTVRASWLDMNENCVDAAHFRFVHGTLSVPPTTARSDGPLHVAESVFSMKMPGGGQGEAKLVTFDHGPGFQLVRMSGLIDTLLVNTATPIDAETTDVSFAYTVRAAGDARAERLAAKVVEDLKRQFEHDRPIWEHKAHWARPALCDGDGPIAGYRRWYSQFV